MICVVTGTNRPQSNSEVVSRKYCEILSEFGEEATQLDLISLPHDFVFADMYGQRTEAMQDIINHYIVPAEKFVFVIPEYNGGFPGILKSFLDAVPPATFHGKKAALIGLSSGKAGSLRGMDQFTNVLNYLKVNVYHAKPKLSSIEEILVDGKLQHKPSIEWLRTQAEGFIDF